MLLIVGIFFNVLLKIFMKSATIALEKALERFSESLKNHRHLFISKQPQLPLDLSIRIYLAVSVALGIQSEI